MLHASGSCVFESIQRGEIDRVSHLLQQDRGVLKQKGWGGFTALHFAALHGNRPMAELLLNSGADPNIPCDAGQTPFHFACRNGNIYVMQKMMQHGADLHAVDEQGKTSLHHAVGGGSVIATQYLWETGMFHFTDTDYYKVTPLHLAASTGNSDVVRYLLRANRCRPEAVDHQGATALHVAAEKGMIEVCWLLLKSAGLHILHMKNHTGLTPLDLCNQGNTFRHRQLSRMLTHFSQRPKDLVPKDSYGMYVWMLLLPSLSGAAVLIIAAALGEYGAMFSAVLFPCMAKFVLSQYHRLSSFQRLPNPVYLGTLTAGLIHSIACFLYKIVPSFWPAYTLLNVSLVHLCVLAGLFWKVLKQNPGQLKEADTDSQFSSIGDLIEAGKTPDRFCIYCELIQVDNCKHCRLCDMCIQDYDHHCLFLNQCVGRDNHRIFILFIMSMVMAHLVFILCAVYYLYLKLSGLQLFDWGSAAGREAWVLLLTLLNFLSLTWVGWLLIEQLHAISMGTTTYFRRYNHKGPSKRQRLGTILSFLFEGKRRQEHSQSFNI
ncbi:probable protein S-acyltransferase 23 [Puntigrus tetrazona]|uniref:probable protein S-acyltransferase 23 n=1 Tax=Puntigrus tetrazona TaxID=1606681 RepID=UPI001C8AC830|nr:probable protein S-acyltransferase 23 [Puntigrus tetrazona]XP_043110777.1 probable protein S-acyltransferase 23 [Puntigrus tetrazona]XP_043110778.1 probable protein S-acyltransferase 23 [Puntigrus tetrazona]